MKALERDSVTRFFASVFLMNQFLSAPEYSIGTVLIFLKIRGDIRKSRFTTGINDTGGKFATRVNDTGGN
jgi:hypothetical protein